MRPIKPKDPHAAVTDRRVFRTRASLRDALLQLMAERGWEGVDIASLCELANLGRSTFYLHYANKEDLLRGSLDDLGLMLREQAGQTTQRARATLAFVEPLMAHVNEQQAVFRAIVGRRSGQYVQQRFRELLVRLVSEELGIGAKSHWQRVSAANYLAGALFELMGWWLGTRRPNKASEIVAHFHALSSSALRLAAATVD